jgi:hypothetical protein
MRAVPGQTHLGMVRLIMTSVSALRRVRRLCLALPDVTERLSNGAPAFFIADKRMFVTFHDDHHGDGRVAIWCAAPAGAQELLVNAAPEHYFVPPYVAHLGWIGLRLDRDVDWDEVADVIDEAWGTRAPRTLTAKRNAARPEPGRQQG